MIKDRLKEAINSVEHDPLCHSLPQNCIPCGCGMCSCGLSTQRGVILRLLDAIDEYYIWSIK